MYDINTPDEKYHYVGDFGDRDGTTPKCDNQCLLIFNFFFNS